METNHLTLQKLEFAKSHFFEITLKVKNIQRGGCGVFAEYSYELFKNMGLNPKIQVLAPSFWKMTISEAITKKSKNKEKLAFHHIVVDVDGLLIDCNRLGASPSDLNYENCKVVSEMPLNYLKSLNKEQKFWNPCFQRTEISKLKQEFEKLEEKIKKEFVTFQK